MIGSQFLTGGPLLGAVARFNADAFPGVAARPASPAGMFGSPSLSGGMVNRAAPMTKPDDGQPALGPDGPTLPTGMFAGGGRRSGFRDWMTNMAPVVMALGNPQAAQVMLNIRQMQQNAQDNRDRFKLEHMQQSRLLDEANFRQRFQSRPQYRTVNGQVVQLDPMGGGDPEVIYQAPEDFEIYADAMGLEPGTQEYLDAQQDFVLRANGPTALANRTAYEGVRHRNRLGEIDRRESHIRARPPRAPTSRPNPGSIVAEIMDKQRRGERLSSGEEQVLREWQAGRGARNAPGRADAGRASSPGRAGQGGANGRQWITDAQGNRIEAEVRNGQWFNVATGQPL